MRWSPVQIASAAGGTLVEPGAGEGSAPVRTVDRVTIDSRTVSGGDLFVAIRAERDGHDFARAAVEQGAAVLMLEREKANGGFGVPVVSVDDTARSLLALGSAARDRMVGEVIGVTGSVGKTSTKDLIAAAAGAEKVVAASERSFNNELGVPLTLANAPDATEVAVIEMGARGPGHIALLCGVARPTVAVVTAVAAAHTEAFGDLDQVALAKGELVEALPASGAAVLNGDDHRVSAMSKRSAGRVLRYSASGDSSADLIAASVRVDDQLRPGFVAVTPWGRASVQLEARGRHQVGNALAAIAAACVSGVALGAAAEGLARAALSPWRMELARTRSGAVVINDAYNANPASMAAALDALATLPARRRIAVLGEMAELGDRSGDEHRSVARRAAELGIDVIAVGTTAYGIAPLSGLDEAAGALADVAEGDAVLVKGSRVVGLERLASLLVDRA